ncbi:MAG TPA: DsbA family protein [Burkholderiales bacterium]|nr:DsbA family protein [Burkholderiales bacterium]
MESQQTAQEPLRVVVFADFVCPYSFLAVEQIDRIAREYGVTPLWRPHWLHPDTPPEGQPGQRSPERAERLRAWIKDMAPDHLDRIRIPEKRQYSFRAFEALEFAYDHGLDFPYKTALYDLMWTEERDIGEIDTLVDAGARVGLDRAEMKTALEEHHYAERALEAVQQARRIGIENTPTIFLGKTRINGWTYYEVMQKVIEGYGVKPLEAQAA